MPESAPPPRGFGRKRFDRTGQRGFYQPQTGVTSVSSYDDLYVLDEDFDDVYTDVIAEAEAARRDEEDE